jgi:hypothetical protein
MSILAPFFCPFGREENVARMGKKKSNDGPIRAMDPWSIFACTSLISFYNCRIFFVC